MTTTSHHLRRPLRLPLPRRSLAGHHEGQLGEGDAEGSGQGRETGRGRDVGTVSPVAQGVRGHADDGSGLDLGAVALEGQESGTQICVLHNRDGTQICVPSRGLFAGLRSPIDSTDLNFYELLFIYMRRKGLNKTAFAKAAGISKQLMTNFTKQDRSAPLEKIDRCAEVLGLSKNEKQLLRDLAAVTHMPDESQARFVGILHRLEALDRSLDGI